MGCEALLILRQRISWGGVPTNFNRQQYPRESMRWITTYQAPQQRGWGNFSTHPFQLVTMGIAAAMRLENLVANPPGIRIPSFFAFPRIQLASDIQVGGQIDWPRMCCQSEWSKFGAMGDAGFYTQPPIQAAEGVLPLIKTQTGITPKTPLSSFIHFLIWNLPNISSIHT